MKFFTKIGICLFIVAAFFSCSKESDFPNIPFIETIDFQKTNNLEVIWKIRFTDGDGDVGVRNEADPDNFIVEIFVVENGVAYIDSNLQASNYRIPVVQGIRTAKGVEGEIEITIDGLDFLNAAGYDSLYYTGFLIDRSLNKSNTIRTPTFSTN